MEKQLGEIVDICKEVFPDSDIFVIPGKIIQGDTYEERIAYQIEEWVKGNSIHNTVEDECCPDFSCCNKDMLADEKVRKQFQKAINENDNDMMDILLVNFLGMALEKAGMTVKTSDEVLTKEEIEDER